MNSTRGVWDRRIQKPRIQTLQSGYPDLQGGGGIRSLDYFGPSKELPTEISVSEVWEPLQALLVPGMVGMLLAGFGLGVRSATAHPANPPGLAQLSVEGKP